MPNPLPPVSGPPSDPGFRSEEKKTADAPIPIAHAAITGQVGQRT